MDKLTKQFDEVVTSLLDQIRLVTAVIVRERQRPTLMRTSIAHERRFDVLIKPSKSKGNECQGLTGVHPFDQASVW